jgi:formiminoglutamase
MKLPILMSVPHAGLRVPPEAEPYCCLRESDIIADGDEGAAESYDLADHVTEFVTTDIARAIVDQNRAEDDRRADGVVKTHTCWNVPVYREELPTDVIAQLLDRYYHPYHHRLSHPMNSDIKLCVDCHTMAAVGPAIGPDTGEERPAVCLGDANGASLPAGWIDVLTKSFRDAFFNLDVTVNKPFSGGYVTRCHGQERPWLQIELSRAPFLPNDAKRERVLRALEQFCDKMF